MDEYQYRKDVREVIAHSQESYREADRLLQGSKLEIEADDDNRNVTGIVWPTGFRSRQA